MTANNLASLESLPDILDAKTISEFLSIGYVKSLKLIQYGDIPYLKIGNTYRVSKQNFLEWLNQSGKREIQIG